MSSVNEPNYAIDQTVRVFDDFYQFELRVPVNEYDVVNSYFYSVMKDRVAAQNFTTTLFRISQELTIPIFDLLQQVRANDAITLTGTMAYYLNGLRSKSTLLGVNAVVTPNPNTARNVIQ